MTDDVLISDHARGCAGREYACTCGYDAAWVADLDRLRAELAEAHRRIATLECALRSASAAAAAVGIPWSGAPSASGRQEHA